MKYYAVIDTNVLVSGMLKSPSIPNEIMSLSLVVNIISLINETIMAEYREVMKRPKFQFPQLAVETLISEIIKRGIWQIEEHVEEEMPDPKDRIFYETVVAGRKEYKSYLVTGNKKHFPERDFIVTPHEMLEIVRLQETN